MNDLIFQTQKNIKDLQKNTSGTKTSNLVAFSSGTLKKVVELKKYLFKNLYRSQEINIMRSQAEEIINTLFEYYLDNLEMRTAPLPNIAACP